MDKILLKARKQYDRLRAFSASQEAAKGRAIDAITKLLDEARAAGASEQDILEALHPKKDDRVIIDAPAYEFHGQKGRLISTNGNFGTIKINGSGEEHECYLGTFLSLED